MKVKFLIIIYMIMIFSISLDSNVSANRFFVIGEEKAGGYQYTVIKEQNKFIWEIGHQDNLSTIEENKLNIKDLEGFRTAVEDINLQILNTIISTSAFLIVVITILILYRKNKQMLKGNGAIITIIAGIALYYTILNSIDLNTSFQNAEFYYLMLTN